MPQPLTPETSGENQIPSPAQPQLGLPQTEEATWGSAAASESPMHNTSSEQTPSGMSESNSKKLDRLIFLLEGQGIDAPGLIHRLNMNTKLLLGESGEGGIAHKVNVMWRAHVWLLCTLSAGVGFLLKVILETIV